MSGGSGTAGRGLRSPFFLARRPGAGIALVLLGIAAFSVLAVGIRTPGLLPRADLRILTSLHSAAQRSSPLFHRAMTLGFYIGQHGVVLAGVLLALYFFRKRRRPELAIVVIAWLGDPLIWFVLTRWFQRPRPVLGGDVWRELSKSGFPSGHGISAVMGFGLLAYFLWPSLSSLSSKAAVVAGAALIILLIGLSRVFLGDHFPSDVLAGYALGLAWSAFVVLAVETRFKGATGRLAHGPDRRP